MGFEPTTPTLARLCSTPELRPLGATGAAQSRSLVWRRIIAADLGLASAIYPLLVAMRSCLGGPIRMHWPDAFGFSSSRVQSSGRACGHWFRSGSNRS